MRERTRETERGGNRQRLCERELERQREGETDRDCLTRETERRGNRQRLCERELERQRGGKQTETN